MKKDYEFARHLSLEELQALIKKEQDEYEQLKQLRQNKRLETRRKNYQRNKDKYKKIRDSIPLNIKIYRRMKVNAEARGIPFDISPDDIVVPELCPVFQVPMTYGKRPYSPSVDRIDNTKGYTKDNIAVISFRANCIKNDATIEEMQKVLDWYKSVYKP